MLKQLFIVVVFKDLCDFLGNKKYPCVNVHREKVLKRKTQDIKLLNTLFIEKDKLRYNNKTFVIDDLYTTEFLLYSNKIATGIEFKSYFVNEIFLNTIQPYLALKRFVEINSIKYIVSKDPQSNLYAIAKDLAENGVITFSGKSKFLFLTKIKMYCFLYMTLTTIYLVYCMLLIPEAKGDKTKKTGELILIRTNAAEKKFNNFTIPKYYEDIRCKNSLYSQFKKSKRVLWVLQSYINSFYQMRTIILEVKDSLGRNSVLIPYQFYSKRIVHTMLYQKLLSSFFSVNKFDTFYTGNNLDRFAIIEETLTEKYGIKSIGIPHGLEYGFRLPKVFTSDLFYATSQNAAFELNKLYKTNKFIFDKNITKKIFKIRKEKKSTNNKVVYFTEPRESEVNVKIIKYIIPRLQKEKIPFFVKLHPKDKRGNYSEFNLNYIDELEDALIENVCIARKSTILLECIYNSSKSAAILINSKDKAIFSTFPSLQSDDIYVSKCLESLVLWIVLNYNNEKINKNEEL